MIAQALCSLGAIVWLVASWILWCRRNSFRGVDWAGTAFSRQRLKTVLIAAAASAMGVVIASPSLRAGVISGLQSDSLFTLEPWEAAAVTAISTVLCLAGILLSVAKTLLVCRRTPPHPVPRAIIAIADILVTASLFAVFYSVAPQLYYEYYRIIIPGLPDQWVVQSRFDPSRLITALSLPSTGRLAELAAGLVFWTVLIVSLWFHAADFRKAARI